MTWHTVRDDLRRSWAGLRDCAHWKAVFFVAAVVSLLHHHGYLDVIDTYALLAVSNLASTYQPPCACGPLPAMDKGQYSAIALEIDQRRFDTFYEGRSPLNRCQLRNDLELIYQSRPQLLVIDLDLSPARMLVDPRKDSEQICENALYTLIRDRARETPTVLMEPFEVDRIDGTDSPYLRKRDAWLRTMKKESAGVTFGDADIPVTYGLVVRYHDGPDSLVQRAHIASSGKRRLIATRPAPLIDPRKYVRADGVHARALYNPVCPWHILTKLPGQIVFFGAAYGSQGDTFLTPVREVYGVEVHAAAFLSYFEPLGEPKLSAFVIDLVFAFIFSWIMALTWRRYLALRTYSQEPHVLEAASIPGARVFIVVGAPSREDVKAIRARAGLFAFFLTVLSILLLFVSLIVSVYLLARWAIWASPLPILVGMLIDSIVTRWHEDSEPHERGERRDPRHGHAPILTRFRTWVFAEELWHRHWGSALWVTVCRVTWLLVLTMQMVCLAHHPACDVLGAWLERFAEWVGRIAEWVGRVVS